MMEKWIYIIALTGFLVAAFILIRYRERGVRMQTLKLAARAKVARATQQELMETYQVNLLQISRQLEAEKDRKWLNEGITLLNEIISAHRADLCVLTQEFMTKLCAYTGANSCAIWLLREEDGTETLIEYGRTGSDDCENSRFMVGEGLVGTCYKEAQIIALGATTPRFFSGLPMAYVTLFPIRMEEVNVGVLEIIFEQDITENASRLIVSVLENMATTINVVEINARNDRHITHISHQSEDVRNQEKELRHKLEEMRKMEEEALSRQKQLEAVAEEYQKDEKNYDQELRKLRKRVKMLETQYAKLLKYNEKLKTLDS